MNWWPFVSRACFDLLKQVSDSRMEIVQAQNEHIKLLNAQILELKGLFNRTTNFEIVEQSESGVKLKMKEVKAPAVAGRGAWRARRAVAEAQTREKPQDSYAAPEARVAEAAKESN